MKLIAQYGDEWNIYDDGDSWYTLNPTTGDEISTLKSKNPYYPLAAVLKYDYETVDADFMNKLAKQAMKEVEDEKAANAANN